MVALKWSMHDALRHRAGRGLSGAPPTSAGWSAIPTSSTAPLLHGCTTVLYEGKPVGTPDAGAFWRVIVRARGRRPVHRADRLPRHQEGGSERRAPAATTTCRASARLFLAGERADPDTVAWAEQHARRAGDRPLVADRDRLGHRRQSARARRAAGQARLADRADAGLRRAGRSTRAASRCRPDTMGTIAIKLPLPPGCLPTLWQADERFRESYLADLPGLLQHLRRRLPR